MTSPLERNITREEVGSAGMLLLSDHARGITGEILHVDCGYNVMGSPGRAIEKVKKLILEKVKAANPALAAALENDSELKRL
jgi:enoyl-[acyl-carrier-protein] reductase (NADH)